MNSTVGYPEAKPLRGITALGIFLMFGTVMALLAGVTLVSPGTVLDRMWVLNPRAHQQLAPLGKAVGIPFLLLSAGLGAAALGWFNHRSWGWRLAVFIIATQILGDIANIFMGRIWEGSVGTIIAGALLLYLLRPNVKAVFH